MDHYHCWPLNFADDMEQLVNFLSYLALFHLIAGQFSKEKVGPYDVIIHYVENCQNPGPSSIQFSSKLKKYNRSVIAMDANVSFGTPLDDNLKGVITLAQFTNGGWKDNFYRKEFENSCSTLKFYAYGTLEYALSRSNYRKKSCPIPKGNYSMNDFALSIEMPAVPIFFYNKYKYELKGFSKGKQVGCLRAEIDIAPKKQKKG